MAKGDEYLDYETKPWNALLGAFLKTKCWGFNLLYGQKMGNSQSHPSRISEIEVLIHMLASCLLCITHEKTTNKEQRLLQDERPSLQMKYWNALPVWQIIRVM